MENKLWYYRNQKALTLQELSRLSGISVAALNKIENGNTKDILLSNAITLSRVLNVDIYELFCIIKYWGGDKMYFNLICEELCITGGKVIHIDTNVGSLEEVHKIVTDNADKYPNGKWELYPMQIAM